MKSSWVRTITEKATWMKTTTFIPPPLKRAPCPSALDLVAKAQPTHTAANKRTRINSLQRVRGAIPKRCLEGIGEGLSFFVNRERDDIEDVLGTSDVDDWPAWRAADSTGGSDAVVEFVSVREWVKE